MGEEKDKEMYLNACLEEYKSIREESRQASVNMFRSLSIGIGAAAIAIVASFNFINKIIDLSGYELIIILSIFCVIVPFLLALITVFWLGELARFKRAGNYLCFIEAKVSLLFDDYYNQKVKNKWEKIQKSIEEKLNVKETFSELGRPIQWEIWLRSFEKKKYSNYSNKKNKRRAFFTSGHMKWIYITRLALLALSFYITLFVGIKLVNYSDMQVSSETSLLFNLWMVIIGLIYFIFVFIISIDLGIKQGPITLSKIFSEIKTNENKSEDNQ
jgi:hypothetical protein